mmetsp:Transcript_69236/g.157052  ORF Transcript_69236/g.157052 Transcript_69236/m.157052 type:complete len:196 (-) Transcript_69236:61-648(-)
MRAFAVALCGAAVASAFPTPEKFKPLIAACEGNGLLSNCTATMRGVCRSISDGTRLCGCEHSHGGLWKKLSDLGHKFGLPRHEHGWPHVLGDCATKRDGEECQAPRPGKCIPSGKCPMFHGEMVCRPDDAHPPSFVTGPCKGKKEGESCKFASFIPGRCEKAKYTEWMACKVPWMSGHQTNQVEEDGKQFSVMVV